MNENKKPTTMLIEANFDIDQVGQTLEWRFSRKDGHGNPVKGRYAGGVYFTVGEQTRVRVRAGSYNAFNGFKVIDCTLITMPQVVRIGKNVATRFAPVSPFVSSPVIQVTGASVSLPPAQFVPSAVHPDDPEYNEFALEWGHELSVGPETGRWEISFVLTVEIQRADGCTEQRAFSFDPEGEVGTGLTPPKIQAAAFEPMPMAMLMP
ncbi:MAG TPA: hypothetical protein VGC21_05935, partial [Telluria sp.]